MPQPIAFEIHHTTVSKQTRQKLSKLENKHEINERLGFTLAVGAPVM